MLTDYGPFTSFAKELDKLPGEIKKSLGKAPDRAYFKPLRDSLESGFATLTTISLFSSVFDLFVGWQNIPIKQLFNNTTLYSEINPQLGTLFTSDSSYKISYFTSLTLSASLIGLLLSKMVRVNPDNEQASASNAIRHLWRSFAQAYKDKDCEGVLNTLSTLADQQKKYPKEFNHSLKGLSWKDENKFSRLEGVLYYFIYQKSKDKDPALLKKIKECFTKANCYNEEILGWYEEAKNALGKDKENVGDTA